MIDLSLPNVIGQVTPMIAICQSKQRNIPAESLTKPLRVPHDLAANSCRVYAWVKNFHAGREGIGGEAESVVGLSH
jgi:hypothetical protein